MGTTTSSPCTLNDQGTTNNQDNFYDPNPTSPSFPSPAPILALFGPSRSGKTTICAQISFSFPTYHQNGLYPVDNLGNSSSVVQQALKQIFYSMQELIKIALDNEELGKEGYMQGMPLPESSLEDVMMYDLKGRRGDNSKLQPLDEDLADAIKILWAHPNIRASWNDKPKSIPDGSAYLFRNVDLFVGDYDDEDSPMFPILNRRIFEDDKSDDEGLSSLKQQYHNLLFNPDNHHRRQLLPISFPHKDTFWCSLPSFPASTIFDHSSTITRYIDLWDSISTLVYVSSLADYIYGPRIGPDGTWLMDSFQTEDDTNNNKNNNKNNNNNNNNNNTPTSSTTTTPPPTSTSTSLTPNMPIGTLGLDGDILRFKQFFESCEDIGLRSSKSSQQNPSIVQGHPVIRRKKLHLVLNKLDLFEERLSTHPFQQYQPKYNGDGSTHSIIDWIKYRFSSVIPLNSNEILLDCDDGGDGNDDTSNNDNGMNTDNDNDDSGNYTCDKQSLPNFNDIQNEYNLENPHLNINTAVKIHIISALSETDIKCMTGCVFHQYLNK